MMKSDLLLNLPVLNKKLDDGSLILIVGEVRISEVHEARGGYVITSWNSFDEFPVSSDVLREGSFYQIMI